MTICASVYEDYSLDCIHQHPDLAIRNVNADAHAMHHFPHPHLACLVVHVPLFSCASSVTCDFDSCAGAVGTVIDLGLISIVFPENRRMNSANCRLCFPPILLRRDRGTRLRSVIQSACRMG